MKAAARLLITASLLFSLDVFALNLNKDGKPDRYGKELALWMDDIQNDGTSLSWSNGLVFYNDEYLSSFRKNANKLIMWETEKALKKDFYRCHETPERFRYKPYLYRYKSDAMLIAPVLLKFAQKSKDGNWKWPYYILFGMGGEWRKKALTAMPNSMDKDLLKKESEKSNDLKKLLNAWKSGKAPPQLDKAANAMGEKCVPVIVAKMMQDGYFNALGVWALPHLAKHGERSVPYIIKLLDSKNFMIRRIAFKTLENIGPPAQKALPALQKNFKSSNILKKPPANIFATIDPQSDFALKNASLIEEDFERDFSTNPEYKQLKRELKQNAAYHLRKQMFNNMKYLLKNKCSIKKENRLEVLMNCNGNDKLHPQNIPFLLEIINGRYSASNKTRAYILLSTFSDLSDNEKQLLNAYLDSRIQTLLNSTNLKKRKAAAIELKLFKSPFLQKKAVNALFSGLQDPEDLVSDTAQKSLEAMGPSIIPELLEAASKNDDSYVASAACEIIGKLSIYGKPAMPELEKIAEDESKDREVRSAAIEAIGEIGEPTKNTRALLIRLLDNKDQEIKRTAVCSLLYLGKIKDKTVIDKIREFKLNEGRLTNANIKDVICEELP